MITSGFLRRLPVTEPLTHLADDARTLVLHFRHDPSVHYYWKSRYPDGVIIDTSITRNQDTDLTGFDQIIIVRHIGPAWLAELQRRRPANARILYFLDDDIPGLMPDGFLPVHYVLKNRYRYLRSLRKLDRLCDGICVSTATLADRYALPSDSVIEPLPCESDLPRSAESKPDNASSILIFYHATGSHLREIDWLRPVIKEVADHVPNARFELFGDRQVERMFDDLSSVSVLSQMPWSNYRLHCHSKSYAIGLAPLLPTQFNAVRSHVKFYDITRCGAAGIYSNRPPFSTFIDSDVNGLLVDDSPQAWVDAILSLIRNYTLRKNIADQAAMKTMSKLVR